MNKRHMTVLLSTALLVGCSGSKQSSVQSVIDSTQPEETAAPEVTPESSAAEEEYGCRVINYYDYTKPVPKAETIEDDYFKDAFFGGDSRMGSLYLYSDLQEKGAKIHYAESLSMWTIETMALFTDKDSTLMKKIQKTKRKNIYLLLGINEIRYNNFDEWGIYYKEEVIDPLLKRMPDANVYLLLNYPAREISGLTAKQLKKQLKIVNNELKKIAVEDHVYFIDISDEMTDKKGLIKSEYVWDGLHFNTVGSQVYADYIADHVVKEEMYVKKICE